MLRTIGDLEAPTAIRLTGLAGVVFLTIGLVLAGQSYNFSRNAAWASGTVVGLEVDYAADGTTYRPVVEFRDTSGNLWRGKAFLLSSGYDFETGTRLDILYDTRNPEAIRMDNWMELWGFGLVFVLAGVLILWLYGAMVYYNRR